MDFGAAALCHLTAGRAERDLITALNALPRGPVLEAPLAIARLVAQAQDEEARGELPLPQSPGLALSYAEALPFATHCTPTENGADLVIKTTTPAARRPVVRLHLSEEFTAFLNALLAKTLVPDTAASRLGGAGAGLTDND